ncbi:MAG TPA: zf-HC2 domain-containing protein [Gaiellaceae bacterium]|jgi:predicted anti-sigma-YlaC factor YlaD
MALSRQCERCREWVSLDLDAELSEFEAAVMHRHLRACSPCRDFAHDVRAATSLVRAARPVALELTVPAPERPRRRVAQRVSFGAAIAAASIAAVFASGVPGDQRSDAVTAVRIAGSGNVDLANLRALRRAELHVPRVTLDNLRIRVVELG